MQFDVTSAQIDIYPGCDSDSLEFSSTLKSGMAVHFQITPLEDSSLLLIFLVCFLVHLFG